MFLDMYSEVRGAVPKLPVALARKLIQRAWADVRRKNLWSFQLYDGPQWIAPPQITDGTVHVINGSNQVVVSGNAATAIDTINTTYSLITARQFRVAIGTIYNIWGWDSGTQTLTLDRVYGEATNIAAEYSIYQVYYPAPYQDHLRFISIRDMQNFIDLFIDKTRAMIDATDPQRSWYYFPTDVVYYQQNQNPNASTYLWPMYELWGAPTYALNYQLYGIRRGPNLTLNTDVLPPAVGEDCVIEKAKWYAYQWAEANKGEMPKNQGADFKFLMGESQNEYTRLFKDYRRQDRETVNNWFAVRRISMYGKYFAYYNSVGGTAYPGASMGG